MERKGEKDDEGETQKGIMLPRAADCEGFPKHLNNPAADETSQKNVLLYTRDPSILPLL